MTSVKAPEIMPDLTGELFEDAQAELVQYNVRIIEKSKISSEPAGTVIEQDPVAGADFSQTITLTVSTAPPTVPDVTGQTFGKAEEALVKLGFEVVENPVFDQTLADGLVQAQDPPAGATNAAEVTLSVVRRPVVAFLADMEPVSKEAYDYFTPGIQKSNGKSYSHGLLIDPRTNGATIEYDFSRQYRRMTGELGLDDKSASSALGKVEIYGDGRLLTTVDVPFGTTIPVDLDVTNVLRLKINVSVLDGSGAVVFGDFQAQGLQSEVSTTTTTGG